MIEPTTTPTPDPVTVDRWTEESTGADIQVTLTRGEGYTVTAADGDEFEQKYVLEAGPARALARRVETLRGELDAFRALAVGTAEACRTFDGSRTVPAEIAAFKQGIETVVSALKSCLPPALRSGQPCGAADPPTWLAAVMPPRVEERGLWRSPDSFREVPAEPASAPSPEILAELREATAKLANPRTLSGDLSPEQIVALAVDALARARVKLEAVHFAAAMNGWTPDAGPYERYLDARLAEASVERDRWKQKAEEAEAREQGLRRLLAESERRVAGGVTVSKEVQGVPQGYVTLKAADAKIGPLTLSDLTLSVPVDALLLADDLSTIGARILERLEGKLAGERGGE